MSFWPPTGIREALCILLGAIIALILVGSTAPLWMLILLLILLLLIGSAVIDGLLWLVWQIRKWLATPPCTLVTQMLFKDYCDGSCTNPETCVATHTRPYGPFGAFGTQAFECDCVADEEGESTDQGGSNQS